MLLSTQVHPEKKLNFLSSFSLIIEFSEGSGLESWLDSWPECGMNPFLSLRPQDFLMTPEWKDLCQESLLSTLCEVADPRQLEPALEWADVLQVGPNQMYNYELLKELGRIRKPVVLKRGLTAYLSEFISAADYILSSGNPHVILCERGIRTFEKSLTLDLTAVPYLQNETGLPVIVDPTLMDSDSRSFASICYAVAAIQANGLVLNGDRFSPSELLPVLSKIKSIQKMIQNETDVDSGEL